MASIRRYLSRHGQSEYNAVQKIGGNPGLTNAGETYAKWLGTVVPGEVWTRDGRKTGFSTSDDEHDDDETDDGRADACPGRPLFGRRFPCADPRTGETRSRAIAPARLWTSPARVASTTLTRTARAVRRRDKRSTTASFDSNARAGRR